MSTPTLYRPIVTCDSNRQTCATTYVATLTTEAGRSPSRSGLVTLARLMSDTTDWTWQTAQAIAWERLTIEGAGEVRSRVAAEVAEGRMSPATAARCLGVLRGTLRQAWLVGLLDADTLQRLQVALANVKGSRPPAGRHVTSVELERMFASLANDPTPTARRDAACIALGAIGLRRAEIAGLDWSDLNRNRPDDQDGMDLRVRGKGHKVRIIRLTNGALQAVLAMHDPRQSGPMFTSGHRSRVGQSHRVTASGLRHILAQRIAEARCQLFTWHDLRRTFAGNALDAGVDLPTVQAIMGHESPTTTARYDRRPDARRAAAMQTVCIPYHAPR